MNNSTIFIFPYVFRDLNYEFMSYAIYVTDKSDRTSSMPSTILHLKLDQGQGIRSGLLVSFNRVLQAQ